MADHATEEEQLEAIRRWWRENARAVVAGLIVGVGAIVGWQGWSWYHDSQAVAASAVYDEVMAGLEGGDRVAVAEGATTLREDYGGTTYAGLGALAAARAAVDAGDLDAAAEWLRWTVEEASGADLPYVARARLARVTAARGNPGEAQALLEAEELPQAYSGLFAEIRGDIRAQQGDRTAAAEAYRQALDAAGPVSDPELVRRKLNRFGGADSEQGTGATAS